MKDTYDQSQDQIFMQRAIDLAVQGFASTGTNPMVGAVLVYNNRIIGEGFHARYGGNHAEIEALESVCSEDKTLIPLSTLYVTLEPCSHIGKTPPCASKIVSEGIRSVVVGCQDPNPKVAGKGLAYLKMHDVKIEKSSLASECATLLRKFRMNLAGLPYVQLKWAQSQDGFIGISGQNIWMSNTYTRILTHQHRSQYDAILIGKNTALVDNPVLDARYYSDRKPVRILLDRNLEVPKSYHLYDNNTITLVFNSRLDHEEGRIKYIRVDTYDIEVLLRQIFKFGVTSLIVEGGAQVLHSFIKSGFWNESLVIKTSARLVQGIPAPVVQGVLKDRISIMNDELLCIANKYELL